MNILILRVSAIGDVVHTLPAIHLLKRLFPDAKISWIVQEKAADLLLDQPLIERVFVLRNKFLNPKNWRHTYNIIKQLRQTQWDAILDFQGLVKTSALLMLLKGVSYGFNRTLAREGISSWFTNHKTTPCYTNIVQKNLGLASSLQADSRLAPHLALDYQHCSPTIHELKHDFFLQIPATKKTMVDEWLTKLERPGFIVLAPNTTWESKRWPTTNWQELLKLLPYSLSEHHVILIGEYFGSQARDLATYCSGRALKIYRTPKWDLRATSYLISKSALLIAPDTGLLHLGDYLGIETIGIFGPTSAKKHGPFFSDTNKKNVIQIPCSHYYQKQHGSEKISCMMQLTPSMLLKNIKFALKYSSLRQNALSNLALTKQQPAPF